MHAILHIGGSNEQGPLTLHKILHFKKSVGCLPYALIELERGLKSINSVSHPLAIKRKTLFLKIELNAFSNRAHIYRYFEKKNQIPVSQKLTKW